ncbi:hypothetical protein Vadar_032826 [Vaccinium darrowii]|uniref:Uncharacterized protein n=1 Tax=Vaccinium darrowii TaxID=229202 RepID=A0ACB7YBJ4_9ERIC|nr:hypothetical protein Vadar_032826 [Vaccinium darrowii]
MHRREGSNEGTEKDEGIIMKVWDCGSPLYDSYELASLGHVIDRHVLALPFLSGSWRPVKQISHSSAVFPIAEEEIESKKAKGCSMVSCVGDLLEKFLWKRRQKEEKPMKVMNSGFCSNIWNRVGPRALEYRKSSSENVQEI